MTREAQMTMNDAKQMTINDGRRPNDHCMTREAQMITE
jgi:hypothetical protein